MLKSQLQISLEAGTDEAGRGCLAGQLRPQPESLQKVFVNDTLT